MFQTVPLSIIRSFSLYTQQWYMSYRFADSLQAGTGRSSVLFLFASCMSYTIVVCTVKKLLMMDRGTVRNMLSFSPKINLRNWCIWLVLSREFITIHGHLTVNVFMIIQ